MIRITQLVHGKGTVSEALKHREKPPDQVPSELLAFAETRRPIIFWNITNKCNLACTHCYINAGPGVDISNELSLAEAKAFIDDLAEMRAPLILFTGGEPLMRTDFWELASYATEQGLKTAVSTNGTLITKKVAARLKAVGIEYVGISLDGAKEETHDAMRNQPGCFKKVVQALKNCAEIDVKAGIRITITKSNYQELESLLDLSLELNVPRFCLYWLVPSGRGKEIYDIQLEPEETARVFDLLYQRACDLSPDKMEILTVDAPQDGILLLNKLKADNNPEYENALKLLQYTGDSCSAGDRVANVDPTGNVYPCQFAQLEQFKIGNIRERKFSELWNDPENHVLAAFREKTKLLKGKCGSCQYKELCGGGCRIRAYAQDGDIWAEDPLCPLELDS
uniref:PqqA peptide cyclase n=1 Tax=Candidatus Methanophaga sp. ANME-1 ERB7 TaxID=2759913 RepID=A0A7G9ZC12_9EURY|nr:PqqA peptide cyclase [Methanosarcinales archaeon ANME-1 ERB7]